MAKVGIVFHLDDVLVNSRKLLNRTQAKFIYFMSNIRGVYASSGEIILAFEDAMSIKKRVETNAEHVAEACVEAYLALTSAYGVNAIEEEKVEAYNIGLGIRKYKAEPIVGAPRFLFELGTGLRRFEQFLIADITSDKAFYMRKKKCVEGDFREIVSPTSDMEISDVLVYLMNCYSDIDYWIYVTKSSEETFELVDFILTYDWPVFVITVAFIGNIYGVPKIKPRDEIKESYHYAVADNLVKAARMASKIRKKVLSRLKKEETATEIQKQKGTEVIFNLTGDIS